MITAFCILLLKCKRAVEHKRLFKKIMYFCVSHLHVLVFRRQNTEPVCSYLQAQILTCYKDNKGETLRCSDLAKEYMRCIHEAKKVRGPTSSLGEL